MDLDRVAAELRPRTNWEAVDLGVALYRRFWRPMLLTWCFTALPACVVIFAVLAGQLWWSLLALWLLRPLFDRVPLYVLSRSLFGAVPTLGDTLRALPRLWTRDALFGLIVQRVRPTRALLMPVTQLERLSGRARRQRERVLARRTGGTATGVAITALLFELTLVVAQFALLVALLPGELLPDLEPILVDPSDPARWGVWSDLFPWMLRAFVLVAWTITGPLHVATGFALYLNRRTILEGWDVDLGLRRLGARVERAGHSRLERIGAASVLLVALLAVGGRAEAQESGDAGPDDPATVIQEVLDSEEFATSQEASGWRFPERGNSSPGGGGAAGSALAPLFELILWIVAVVVLVGLVYLACKAFGWIRVDAPVVHDDEAPPTELFGLDLRPETMPDDVPGTALALWRAGDAAGALGLLYRASIARLVEEDGLELRRSDTESDCLERARQLGDTGRAATFGDITRAWKICAYSTGLPGDAEVEALCAAWPQRFGRRAA